jgi:hypothetical protein
MCFTIPESPRWLIGRKGDRAAGMKVLKLIEPDATPGQLEADADAILAASSKLVSSTKFWTWRLRVPIMLAFLIAFFNQLSGINAILYFAPRIFQMTGLGAKAALLQSVGIGVTNLIFTFVGLSLIDRLGRRTLLFIGSFGYIALAGPDGLGIFHATLQYCTRMYLCVHCRARDWPGSRHLGVHLGNFPQPSTCPGAVPGQFDALDFRCIVDHLFPDDGVGFCRQVTCFFSSAA